MSKDTNKYMILEVEVREETKVVPVFSEIACFDREGKLKKSRRNLRRLSALNIY